MILRKALYTSRGLICFEMILILNEQTQATIGIPTNETF